MYVDRNSLSNVCISMIQRGSIKSKFLQGVRVSLNVVYADFYSAEAALSQLVQATRNIAQLMSHWGWGCRSTGKHTHTSSLNLTHPHTHLHEFIGVTRVAGEPCYQFRQCWCLARMFEPVLAATSIYHWQQTKDDFSESRPRCCSVFDLSLGESFKVVVFGVAPPPPSLTKLKKRCCSCCHPFSQNGVELSISSITLSRPLDQGHSSFSSIRENQTLLIILGKYGVLFCY